MMFKMISSPHTHSGKLTARIMLWVIAAMLPALIVQIYHFGFGVLIQIALAVPFALLLEFAAAKLRRRSGIFYLADFSVTLTALILAMSIPPYAPFWLILTGIFCAVILGKQVYGGLGQNLFNPAMVGYIVLLISFPLQMTAWLPPLSLLNEPPTLQDSIALIFSGVSTDGFSLHQLVNSIDGISQATSLDTAKIFYSHSVETASHSANLTQFPIFEQNGTELARGWWQVNLACLLGGLFLIVKRTIHWHIPAAMIGAFGLATLIHSLFITSHLSPFSQLFSGALMFGAFFIATDPVTAPVTPKGKLLFGALLGILLYVIRYHGNYPDGVAFAVLLGNICVPLIDHYTRPRVSGY